MIGLSLLRHKLYDPKGRIYGIKIHRYNTWMSFSHITWKHLWLCCKSIWIAPKKGETG